MDWVGILRELRILMTQIQTDRFYALYVLLALVVIAYLIRSLSASRQKREVE